MLGASPFRGTTPRRTGIERGSVNLLLGAGVVLLALLAVWRPWSDGEPERSLGATNSQAVAPAPASLPALQQAGDVSVDPAFDPAADVAVLAWDSSTPAIEFVSPQSGRITARISVGDSARALFRRSAGQLIVSDAVPPTPDPGGPNGGLNAGTRLRIFDLTDRLALQTELAIPNRLRSTVYGQPMELSRDESRLAYVEYQYDTATPGCSESPGVGRPQCDRFRIVEVGLDGQSAIIGAAELPAGSYPRIAAAGAQGFAVTLHDDSVILFGSGLRQQQQVSFAQSVTAGPDYREPAVPSFKAGLLTGLVLGNGQVVGLTTDGVALRGQQRTRLIPESTWLAGDPIALGGDRYALPFRAVRNIPGVEGLAIVDLAAAQVERTVRFPAATWAMPRAGGEILLLRQGSLSVLPAGATAATAERRVGAVPNDAEVIIP